MALLLCFAIPEWLRDIEMRFSNLSVKNTHWRPKISAQIYPKEPTGNFTQKDVAEYVIDGKAAWMDCRNKAEALTLIAKWGTNSWD